ncbi:hypothetical protein EX895_001371 [Sporisorium graminicola]|uniref:FAD dependent oxidoreductase domain-containing protein n=1 Tax=Sporisorium graminicola TaxID=280036 RepID=A0A4U7KYY2_9BASI|nr:hypothetical protein EX895_001371 [Sporisorium graminicola]TKY89586.1 hypothetical protein EX895_001371 [Sporisorium graminicola]
MTSSGPTATKSDYLVVGAGVNGTSIATSLVHLGFSVTLLDRSQDGYVAPDGASNDLNKIIRADYTDANYCTLAKEAISLWRTHPVLSKFYHEVGVLFRSSDKGEVWGERGGNSAQEYVRKGVEHAHLKKDAHLEVGASLPRRAYVLERDAQVAELLSANDAVALGEGLRGMGSTQTGYFNPRGGWAEANNACRALLQHAVRQGVQLHPRSTVTAFITDNNNAIVGVKTHDGRSFYADHIVLAAGAWTSDLLTTLVPPRTAVHKAGWMTRPSAQCVAILRLTAAQAAALRHTPVMINFASGFYQFEPTFNSECNEWHMKIAYHSNGYVYPKPAVHCNGRYPAFEASALEAERTPSRQIGAEGDEGDDVGYDMAARSIPAAHLDAMLAELGQVYPQLARRENVVETRVCWYSDTLDENWILDSLDHHPYFSSQTTSGTSSGAPAFGSNVWVVSGDSGHAYKFLPMIGSLFTTIARLQPNTRQLDLTKFTFAHQQKLHAQKADGAKIESADSNRFSGDGAQKETAKVERNARARL